MASIYTALKEKKFDILEKNTHYIYIRALQEGNYGRKRTKNTAKATVRRRGRLGK